MARRIMGSLPWPSARLRHYSSHFFLPIAVSVVPRCLEFPDFRFVRPACLRSDRCRDRTARFGEGLRSPGGIHRLETDGFETDRSETHRFEAVGGETRCLLCQRADPPFERAVAYGSYDGELRDLIHLLKFQQVRPAAAVLGRVLAGTIANLARVMPVGMIAVVPVPLHTRKQAQRGFNQAEVIARGALKELSLPKRFDLCAGILVRQRETGSQIGLTRHQRRENLRGAFVVSDRTRILNRDVLLVDDVFTTGTTASECTRVLLRAGAARVWVATVARTLKLKIFDGIS